MGGKSHMTKLEREECLELYMAGATIDRLAEKYNRGRDTIIRLVKRNNANRGHKFRAKTRPHKYFSHTLDLDLKV